MASLSHQESKAQMLVPFLSKHSQMNPHTFIIMIVWSTQFHCTNPSVSDQHVAYRAVPYPCTRSCKLTASIKKELTYSNIAIQLQDLSFPLDHNNYYLTNKSLKMVKTSQKEGFILPEQRFMSWYPFLWNLTWLQNPTWTNALGRWITHFAVWYTRHDSGWSTIIKERLKQLYIMLKHSLFPLQTDGPGLQAALDHLNHGNNQI